MSRAAMTTWIRPTNMEGVKKEPASDLYLDRRGVSSAREDAWVQRIKRSAKLGDSRLENFVFNFVRVGSFVCGLIVARQKRPSRISFS